jgi:hypothetical protein
VMCSRKKYPNASQNPGFNSMNFLRLPFDWTPIFATLKFSICFCICCWFSFSFSFSFS